MSFSSDHDFSSSISPKKVEEAELTEFISLEQEKIQIRSQIYNLTDMCWDKCIEKPQPKLDSKTEACLSNCVSRFVDASLLITNRFAQVIQKAAGGGL